MRTWLVFLHWYLFQLLVLLKPDSNCFNSFILSWVNKVTIRTESFLLVILNFGTWSATVTATRILYLGHVNGRVIPQLIKGISSVLQKLLRYFNGTVISTSFVPPFPVCPVICYLKLNEWNMFIVINRKVNNTSIIV